TCSSPDMDNGEVAVSSMGIHKADGQNDIPNANDNVVNQGIIASANDLMVRINKANGNNDYTYSQHEPSTLDVLVDKSTDDFMDVLNDEESIPNYSLDDMKLQDEEEKLISTLAHVNNQQVNELIDMHGDKTTVLQENAKYVKVVIDDYKPCLGMVYANVKAMRKKCGIKRNYVLKSVKERKKRLAMKLDSLFGQQATITLAPT
nr:hypothetical protein [Tanacetum cinerariifolium]